MHYRRLGLFATIVFAVTQHAALAAAPPLEVRSYVPREAIALEEVEIRGRGFGDGTRVFLGDLELAVRVISPYTIKARIPERARSGELVVKRNGTVVRAGEIKILRYHEPPAIHAITPTVVKAGGLLRIKGSGFGEANRAIYVSVGGAIAEVVERSRDALLVRVPEDAHSGAVIVVVQRGGQAIAPMQVRVEAPRVDVSETAASGVGKTP
ncbi:MAG: hypothetical protein GXY23_14070 [Myxococcales bacterium]|jgi:hypothetical protein|nr:hypothetical protein [Myxococcales bacterium]